MSYNGEAQLKDIESDKVWLLLVANGLENAHVVDLPKQGEHIEGDRVVQISAELVEQMIQRFKKIADKLD